MQIFKSSDGHGIKDAVPGEELDPLAKVVEEVHGCGVRV